MVILHVANFFNLRFRSIHALTNVSQRIQKGLEAHNHHVVTFSDKDVMRHCTVSGLKRIGRRRMEKRLLETASMIEPDQVWFGMGDRIRPKVLIELRKRLPEVQLVLYNGDQRDKPFDHLLEKAPLLDWIFSTSGGDNLHWYQKAGCPHSAFFPNMTDASLERHHPAEEKWQSELLFTGGLHGVPEREALIRYLDAEAPITLYRALGRPSVSGRDYFRAISNARIGINISAYPHIDKYLSDRPMHYMGCGTMVLTRHVPWLETLFRPGEELATFRSKEECLEKVRYYLAHDNERRLMAQMGQLAVRQRFNPKVVVGVMLEMIDGNTPPQLWVEMFHSGKDDVG
ncbi:MAG: glycosyltransferase [Magnetococcales bacterium]|nr:glycosyltransferase [Magnetococcales bacterium]